MAGIGTSARGLAKKTLRQFGIPFRKQLEYSLAYLRLMEWVKKHAAGVPNTGRKRYDLHGYVSKYIGTAQPVDYLEFGVYQGESIRFWANSQPHPDSRFFGFDSFEGLPGDWYRPYETLKKGHFSTGGNIPDIDDPRVRFVKGWFNETLPGFLKDYKPAGRLVLYLDADLYSSTLCVLTALHEHLKPGSVIVFDDFDCPVDMLPALDGFATAYGAKYRVLAHSEGYRQLAVELI